MRLTEEEKTFAKLSGIHEQVYLFNKIADQITEMKSSTRLISFECNESVAIAVDKIPERTLTFTVTYYDQDYT